MVDVGIDLGRTADFLGYGKVTTTHTGTMDVVPSVFVLRRDVPVRPNGEVASFRWLGLSELLAPAARSGYDGSFQGTPFRMPAYSVGGYVIWGLTYRIISSLVGSPP